MYPVSVSSKKTISDKNLRKLKKYGLQWDGFAFTGVVDGRKLKKIQYLCQANNYHFKIKNSLGERRPDYRKRFFVEVPPYFGDYYICAYCGRWLKKEKVTVDHLYPIGKVSESIRLQKKLLKKGIKNINDIRNLVPACEPCNLKKGKQVGNWIRRGKYGRNKWLWVVRYFLRAAFVITGIVFTILFLSGVITI